MSTKTEAVDNLQHPTTTFRPILILDSPGLLGSNTSIQ